jgi:autotransporter-associated beta strand protein
VPKGAETLLETRLPYLSADQRRVVLKSTALPSGFPIMSDPEGWGRLNLFAAADGYGAFDGDVTVAMDAAKGGFHAADSWKNDIAGAGRLDKQGSGRLTLSGRNSFTGGLLVEDGAVVAASESAFGKGDVYVAGGRISAEQPLAVAGNLAVRKAGAVEVAFAGKDNGGITVAKAATIEGGRLMLSFAKGYKPAAGETLNLIKAETLDGTFDEIVLDGYKTTPIYSKTGLSLRIDG